MKKRVIKNQEYDEYWKLTLEYSDIYGVPFNRVLSEIINYIDDNESVRTEGINSKQYKELQNIIENIFHKKDSASTRKSINQFLKLGFINNYCMSYHRLAKDFLSENDNRKKKAIYSQILYENASFGRSVTKESNTNEISFLIKTLEACETINKEELLAIMYINTEEKDQKYLTKTELKELVEEKTNLIRKSGKESKKYNQRNYLFNAVCSNLTGVYTNNNILSITPLSEDEKKTKTRDSYLQRIYKTQLMEESKEVYSVDKEICVLEKLAYPVLIASHIKPYRDCDEKEEFDVNNGLLLSKNLDSLFDLGYITFDENGNIIASRQLDEKVALNVNKYKLDESIYNYERHKYMEYHREYVFRGV
ncbi:HNH endonuclease [Faecalimonas sp.]